MTNMTAYGDTVFNLALMNFKELEDGDSYILRSTSMRINYGPGEYDVFAGTGLDYDDEGYPIAGRVTSFTSYSDGKLDFRITNVTGLYATEISDAAKTASVSDDQAVFRSLLSGSDVLIGGSRSDVINGYAGNDEITGNASRDTLTGGPGYDDFNFRFSSDSKTGSGRDRITDFKHGVDDIDVSVIDADGSVSGNGSFTFLATKGASFSNTRGELRWLQYDFAGTTSDKTLVEGDTNGDAIADFQIELTGLVTLSAGDFIL